VSMVYEPWRIRFFIDCERDMIRRGYPKGKSQSQQEQVGETRWVETAGNVQWEVRREVGQDVSDRDPGCRRLEAGKICVNLDEERSSVPVSTQIEDETYD
jgi:hypothetical protein